MKNLLFSITSLAVSLSIAGCATANLQATREQYNTTENLKKIQDIAQQRAQTIRDGDTYYSEKLTCLGNLHREFLTQPAIQEVTGGTRLKVSVAPIYDKTGKIYDAQSTALSDMVIESLSKFRQFDVVETPLSPNNFSASRNAFLDPNYPLDKQIKDNAATLLSPMYSPPIGVLFPTQLHITGALTQYDESTVLPENNSFSVDISPVGFQRSIRAVTVTVNLRLIDSRTGFVARIDGTEGKLASVNLTNTFYTIQTSANVFRIIDTRDYGIDYSVNVGDPQTAVVKEIIDKGIYDLLNEYLKPVQILKNNC